MDDIDDTILKVYEHSKKHFICENGNGVIYNKQAIEQLIPHRDPFLLVDNVNYIDIEKNIISGCCYLDLDMPVFSGHFPKHPVWPGVLQIEAIGQLGIIYFQQQLSQSSQCEVALTHVCSARFCAEVLPNDNVFLKSICYDEGCFFIIVGQCVQRDTICSTVMLKGVY